MVKKFINLFKNPYIIFWGCIPVFLFIGIIQSEELKEEVIDIAIHDTYFVVAHYHLNKFICIFLFFIGLIYYFLKRLKISLNKIISTLHILITIFGCIFILYPFNIFKEEQYQGLPEFSESLNLELTIVFIIIFLVQLLLCGNIFVSIFRNKKSEV